MDISEIAAWWGAVIATIVLVWDVIKWKKSRANVRVSASPNMQSVNKPEGRLEDEKHIFVEVVNQSDRLTTITHLVTKHYSNIWKRLFNKPDMQGVVTEPIGRQPIPYELEPGKRWTGMISQADVEEKTEKGGYLFCGIHHTSSNKAVYVRVKL
ncbi:MAG: hypothetical protein OEZ10_09860 [Gammaproteobacteria bacterium]|nr:hypothetical protein [Gammaproteobacteria bacterium]